MPQHSPETRKTALDSQPAIPSYKLDETYFLIHKTEVAAEGFGSDHTTQLVEDGFGLYSCVNLQDEIGPLKSDFYRFALCLNGSIDVQIGLETFRHQRNTIHFNIPNRVFMFRNRSDDLEAYYLIFTPAFVDDILSEDELKTHYPFFDYLQIPFFNLLDEEARQINTLLISISDEIKANLPDRGRSIKLLLNLVFIAAKRSYLRQKIAPEVAASRTSLMVSRFKKLVGQHFISQRTVKDYADKLAVSVSHLHKLVKLETGKSPGELIDTMLIMEIKALLRYSDLTVSEIAYQLSFTDTSHIAKFFKKYTGLTPSEYRHTHRIL